MCPIAVTEPEGPPLPPEEDELDDEIDVGSGEEELEREELDEERELEELDEEMELDELDEELDNKLDIKVAPIDS